MRSKTIGMLDGEEITRVYAPRKRTVALLSKQHMPNQGEYLMSDDVDADGNVVQRWEDKVSKYAEHYYLPFPWMVFHRFFGGHNHAELFVALMKQFPESLDEPIYIVPLPNVDRNYFAYQCGHPNLTGNIELFWASYFTPDEHLYGTQYGQLLFGAQMLPPMATPIPLPYPPSEVRIKNEKYLDVWKTLEPQEVCERLCSVQGYQAGKLRDLVLGEIGMNWYGDKWGSYKENYKLDLGKWD